MSATRLRRTASARLLALFALCLLPLAVRAEKPFSFVLTFAPNVRTQPFTGRVYVMLGQEGGEEPRLGPDWFQPKPFFAMDVKDWKPDTPLTFDERALGYPASLAKLKTGKYVAQGVLDQAKDTHEIGNAAGNGYSAALPINVGEGSRRVKLRIDQVVEPHRFEETEREKLVDIPSSLLSKFEGHEVRMQAAVVLPKGYNDDPNRLYPVVYIIPGFGGNHFMAKELGRFPMPPGDIEAIRVVLNPDAHTGHSVFADSANNGPRGKALTEELIPVIEKRFRAVGKPSGRFLTGHSSGGWSSLWLQVAYPDFFGGVWSTSPDPVDFRDFQQINIYKLGENMYTDANGKPRPLARFGTEPVLFYKPFCDLEAVLGHGGQMQSFEAVFSPRGEDGQPKKLWNRENGAIDPAVAKAWEKYDISLKLEREWTTLGPKLQGKLHVFTGSLDTFYLDGAVKLLKARLKRLGSDALVEIQPGKDHMTLLTPELQERIGREMMDKFQNK